MPINQALYARLCEADPTCTVEAEGEAADYYLPSTGAGYDRHGSEYADVGRWGECYRLNCPVCGDTRRHLYVCHLAGATVLAKGRKTALKFNSSLCVCHRRHCNRDEPAFKEWLYGLELHRLPVLDLTKGNLHKSSMAHGICAELEDRLPNPTYPLLSSETPPQVLDWLENERRYDPGYLQSVHGVGWCPAGAIFEDRKAPEDRRWRKMRESRLVIPIVQGRVLVGWQARLTRKAGKDDIKYYSSPNLAKSAVLYNLDRAMRYSTAVLVEGPFDAWRVGDAAVAMLGHSLSAIQRLQLKAVYGRNGGGIVMLDAQSPKEPTINEAAKRMATELGSDGTFPRGVVPVILDDGKDPDDRTGTELAEILDAACAQLGPTIRGKAKKEDLDELTRGFAELEGDSE